MQYDVVFCLKQQYYRFPRDAVVEAVNDTSPFEVCFPSVLALLSLFLNSKIGPFFISSPEKSSVVQ